MPNNLHHALNLLTFAAPEPIPKTLHSFIKLAHQPVSDWFPLTIPDEFNPSQPLLYDRRLSDEAEEYQLNVGEKLDLSLWKQDIPQTALDNELMQSLRLREQRS